MGRYRISELAQRAAVRPTTLRYYEQEGLLPCDRTPAGYRMYGEDAVERLAFIAAAKRVGLPLAEIRELLSVWQDNMCTDVRRELRPLLKARVSDANERLQELHDFARRLQKALDEIDGPERPGPCDPDCGFLHLGPHPRLADALPLTDSNSGSNSQEPISCSLDAGGHRERLDEWAALLVDVVSHRDTTRGRRLTFPAVRAGEIARLVVAEQQCCQFFDFTIRFARDLVELEVEAPEAAVPLVAEIFTPPASVVDAIDPEHESR